MIDRLDLDKTIATILATFLAMTVGIPIAAARTDATLPLIASCPEALVGLLTGSVDIEFVPDVIICGTGVIIFLSIPGILGIWWLSYKSSLGR